MGYSPTRTVLPACPAEQPSPQASKTPAGNADRAEEMRLPFADLRTAAWRGAVTYADRDRLACLGAMPRAASSHGRSTSAAPQYEMQIGTTKQSHAGRQIKLQKSASEGRYTLTPIAQ